MKVYHDLTPGAARAAVALGCFDGLHLGHQKVITAARGPGLTPSVLTFADPLGELGGKSGGQLATKRQKLRLFESLGVEQVYSLRFSAIRNLSPEQFVDEVLVRVCHAEKICCGFNFTFGYKGAGTAETLQTLCAPRGIGCEVVPAVEIAGEPVSSTRIRALVEAGEIERANRLLGRPFGFDFEVVRGRQLGRTLGTPTINQVFTQGFVLPRFGVYASLVRLNDGDYYGVTNVGVKPTVGADAPLSETWIPEYHGEDLYGENIQVELIGFIRPEVRFSGVEELQENILRDGGTAERMMRTYLAKQNS
ncbi:riboflavin biosynthesis protein RibF [Clostridium sp. D33t1_170424_F3]|uniref:riboflavin biosynthesis protein RibF n=1 Tax=Clostridium sp. D33t1_170424_F3 TaxID=2787099 RepID=UPI0018AB6F5B|nr:riboflavin biosynthesis protein RibF [Clostridium sp. D33t1_170424_F3]